MNTKPKHSWTASCRRAFTLLEVVASLMLLGTLLVGILVAHRRHVEQIRRAEARLAAVEAADALVAGWSADGSWGPAKNTGECAEHDNFTWRWTVTSAPNLHRLGAAIGRLEVIDASGRVLAAVELLTPDTLIR